MNVIIDLDGTLIKTDLLLETWLSQFRNIGFYNLNLLFYAFFNKLKLKSYFAQFKINPENLPYNQTVLNKIQLSKKEGHKIFLISGAPDSWVQQIADYLQLFDSYSGSKNVNLTGKNKLEYITKELKICDFEYLGDSFKDIVIWKQAKVVSVVNGSLALKTLCRLKFKKIHLLEDKALFFTSLVRLSRVHHWLKNMLLLVPLIGAHQIFNIQKLTLSLIAYFSFSFLASAVYIFNDMIDINKDRYHPDKKSRPLASGSIKISTALFFMLLFLICSYSLSTYLPTEYLYWLLTYNIVNLVYTFYLKRQYILDTIVLSSIYTLRILAGAAACKIVVSDWLLSFSVIFFLCLALLKRYIETANQEIKLEKMGRAYTNADSNILFIFGSNMGTLSVLLFVLYLQSPGVRDLYPHRQFLWLLVPSLIFFIIRLWSNAFHQKIDYDPIIYCIRDKMSWLIIVFDFCILYWASR